MISSKDSVLLVLTSFNCIFVQVSEDFKGCDACIRGDGGVPGYVVDGAIGMIAWTSDRPRLACLAPAAKRRPSCCEQDSTGLSLFERAVWCRRFA